MAIPGETEYVTIHTKFNVLLTSYGWLVNATRPAWSRRWPAWRNGVIERGSQAYGQQVATWCNTYNVDCLSGIWSTGANPLQAFRSAFWNTQTNLGRLKLAHMFWLQGFPSTRPAIEAEAVSWGMTEMQSSKYARIRVDGGSPRPIILFWGEHMEKDYGGFVNMIGRIRSELRKTVGEVFIICTQHIADQVFQGRPGAADAMSTVDGVYNHPCALPGQANVEWNAGVSATNLVARLAGLRDVVTQRGKKFLSGSMGHYDRDLYEIIVRQAGPSRNGRVVAQTPAQLRNLLNTAASFAPVVFSESRMEADGEHIYQDRWIVLTSLNEWEEGTTFEPSLVRGTAYAPPNYDYDLDGMKAISEVFRDRVRRLPVSRFREQPDAALAEDEEAIG